MSKKSLDLEYMNEAVKVKTGVRAGIRVIYGIDPIRFILYGLIT